MIYRAFKVCIRNRLHQASEIVCIKQEMENIKKILLDNGYPKDVIKQQTSQTTARFSTPKPFGPDKCPIYLQVPWMGEPSTNLVVE